MDDRRKTANDLSTDEVDRLIEYAERLVLGCRNSGIADRYEDVAAFCDATEKLIGLPAGSLDGDD